MTDHIEHLQPAFPKEYGPQVSLRDWFALAALVGPCSCFSHPDWFEQVGAKEAYRIADAMLAAREEKQ